jgi:methyl-accepting chemotaxis protein
MQATKPIGSDFTLWFQIKYCLVMLASLAMTSLLIYLYFKHGLGEGYSAALSTLTQVEDALPAALLGTFLMQALLILFFSIAINLFVSHKIAGPIFRFEHTLRCIDDGDLQHVARIRDSDQIKSMVAALNRLITSLRNTYTSLRGVEQELNQLIRQQENGESSNPQKLCQSIAQVRAQLGSNYERKVEE